MAQLSLYRGTVWATWDPAAPPFLEYLGDFLPYIDLTLDAWDGGEGGTEILFYTTEGKSSPAAARGRAPQHLDNSIIDNSIIDECEAEYVNDHGQQDQRQAPGPSRLPMGAMSTSATFAIRQPMIRSAHRPRIRSGRCPR